MTARRAKATPTPTLSAERVRLDRQGYVAKGQAHVGRYFGVGDPVFRVSSDDGAVDEYVRAKSGKDAKAKVLSTALSLLGRARLNTPTT